MAGILAEWMSYSCSGDQNQSPIVALSESGGGKQQQSAISEGRF